MIFVYITCKDKKEAIKIGTSLIKSKLAGCVNILEPMTSIYEWEGKIEVTEEVVLIAKTNESSFEELKSLVTRTHSYSIPCILSFKIQDGNKDYLDWLRKGLKLI